MQQTADKAKPRVLLVEDDSVSQLVIRKLLDGFGYTCIATADNGEKALAIASCERPDIILMDINILGAWDGIQTAEHINKVYSPAIIYVTAQAEVDLVAMYKTMPFGYLRKPIDFDQFKITLELAVRRLQSESKPTPVAAGQGVAHAMFLDFLRNMDIGEVGLDTNGRLLRLTEKAAQLLGKTAAELIGVKLEDTLLYLRDEQGAPAPLAEQPVYHVLRTQSPLFDVALELPGSRQIGLLGSFLPMPENTTDGCRVVVLLKEAASLSNVSPVQDRILAELKSSYESTQYDYDKAAAMFKQLQQHATIMPNWIRSFVSSMKSVGGDIFLVSRGAEAHVWYFLMGDCTGHALHSAIGLLPAIFSFYSMAEQDKSLPHLVRVLNDRIHQALPPDVFVSAILARIDLGRRLVELWNAGAPQVLIADNHGRRACVPSEGLPLGIVTSTSYSVEIFTLPIHPGDRIYIYSDGVSETSNDAGEMFGDERVEALVCDARGDVSRLEAVETALRQFRGDSAQSDDITFAEICVPDINLLYGQTCALPTLPWKWRMSFELDAEAIRSADFKQLIMDLILKAHSDLVQYKEELFMILSELYSNAVSHGVLRLESSLRSDPDAYHKTWLEGLARAEGWIKIDLALKLCAGDRSLEICVEDSGPGFDFAAEPEDSDDPLAISGRGLLLLRALCRELRYEPPGNKAVAVYAW